jgi:glycosyltransferase involved in cell wall biosynthesis
VSTLEQIPAAADTEATPLVSVVIPCLNEAANIERCVIDALAALRQGALDGEVIVVDNDSEDNSAELAAAAGATVILERRLRRGTRALHRDGGRRPHL